MTPWESRYVLHRLEACAWSFYIFNGFCSLTKSPCEGDLGVLSAPRSCAEHLNSGDGLVTQLLFCVPPEGPLASRNPSRATWAANSLFLYGLSDLRYDAVSISTTAALLKRITS